jgi:Na+-translocating ferredoxin:NAD+ oxidoreductase RnfG subunit
MNKLLKTGLILAVIGLVAAALIWKFYVNQPHEDIDSATPAYSMTTDEIWKQYNTDQKTADSLYTNKVIQLSGILSRVDKNDTLVSVIFVMAADEMFGDKTISCQMYNKHNAEASALTAGSKLKVKGFCTGFNDPDIKLNKCSIVN